MVKDLKDHAAVAKIYFGISVKAVNKIGKVKVIRNYYITTEKDKDLRKLSLKA